MISATSIDNTLWAIESWLMTRYGVSAARREISPLRWYVNTGRASTSFLEALSACQPYLVARRLHQGGSDEEIIKRIKKLLKYEPDV